MYFTLFQPYYKMNTLYTCYYRMNTFRYTYYKMKTWYYMYHALYTFYYMYSALYTFTTKMNAFYYTLPQMNTFYYILLQLSLPLFYSINVHSLTHNGMNAIGIDIIVDGHCPWLSSLAMALSCRHLKGWLQPCSLVDSLVELVYSLLLILHICRLDTYSSSPLLVAKHSCHI